MFKLSKTINNFILISSSLTFALFIGEIGLRILNISYPSFYKVDSHRGHSLIYNMFGRWRHEGNASVSINKSGLRDKNYTKKKTKNTFRIVVIGDSFAEAIQLDKDKTFWSLVEQKLSKCQKLSKKNIEVINFGVGDYGTAQEYTTLKYHASQFSPDLVLLAVFTDNDVINNSKILSPKNRFSPFLKLKDDEYIFDMSFRDTKTYQWRNSLVRRKLFFLINKSHIFQLVNQARVLVNNQYPKFMLGEISRDKDMSQNLEFIPELYKESSIEWQREWKFTDELIKLIQEESYALSTDYLVVILSNPIQLYPNFSVREQYFKNLATYNQFYPDQRIYKLSGKENFKALTLAPLLQTYADKNKVFLHGFNNTKMGSGHWNNFGHQIAGEIISNKICLLQK
ncbi:MAG: GDSL-like Lipase/Acylhydrolase [Candidatus Atelocyanobacterium thalassa isolate SIO64986]|uniref:GDSL-like Lipase/Acylhydrolase n=1 Tax=Candidatus Atelocyanobacterium thalassa isolate SIO64986 TaxID=1527444 RepID=A0A086CI43_9CHRO|nr:MAG: GDSL-like Lipase/Acylhydrolase [Candidatus Atelocyanobacterium thalassa isolate SIO64986]